MMNEQQAHSMIKKLLGYSKADHVEVSLNGETTTNLRFARNTPSTSGRSTDVTVTVHSTFGKKTGSASINQIDDDSLRVVVSRAEELAMLSPEDPEYLPPLPPQHYASVHSFDEHTASAGPDVLAAGAQECISQAAKNNLVAAGFIQLSAGFSALGNSESLFGYQQSTIASVSETVRTDDGNGSGWASRASNRVKDLDFKNLSRVAIEKAQRSRSPRKLDPGSYVTILEPTCVAELVQSLVFSMDARSADEGRSFFSKPGGGNRIGETLLPHSVTISSDPASKIVPGSKWGESGLAQNSVSWINKGVVTNLSTSRYWASHQGTKPLPSPSNIIMDGGTGTIDDLIRSTDEGVLVTSFWYIRQVDPRSLLLTGLTRDGVFKIEHGAIAYPIMNFRWNDSPVAVFKGIEAMSAAQRIPSRESRNPSIVIPALKVKNFHFTSLSEAV